LAATTWGVSWGLLVGAAGKDCAVVAGVVALALGLPPAGLVGAGLGGAGLGDAGFWDAWLATLVDLAGGVGLAGFSGGGAVSFRRVPLITRSGSLMLLMTTSRSRGSL
jgi:hypothetical protein